VSPALSGSSSLRYRIKRQTPAPKREAIGKLSVFPLNRTAQPHLKPMLMLSPRLPKEIPEVSSIKLPNQIRMEKGKPQNRSPYVITFLPFSDHVNNIIS